MKTIRIALDDSLLTEVDRLVESRFTNRAEFFRQACAFFLRSLNEQQMDQAYKRGYEQQPEAPETAQVSAWLAGSIMEKEDWE